MTTVKKSSKRNESHETTTHRAADEGAETMKTTTKSHATHATPTHATNEGETTMNTTKTSHPETTAVTTVAATTHPTIAATPAAPPTPMTSPGVAATLAYIQTCTTLLDQLEAAFPQGESLTTKDKQRKAKARKGSERFAPQLVALAKQHGVNLSLVPLDAITNASAEATALVPVQKRMEGLATRAASRMFGLQSATWSGSAKLYTVMKRLSRDSGDIEAGLAPVEQFFNHRHPSVAKNHPKTQKGKEALAAEKAAVAAPVETAVAVPAGGATHA